MLSYIMYFMLAYTTSCYFIHMVSFLCFIPVHVTSFILFHFVFLYFIMLYLIYITWFHCIISYRILCYCMSYRQSYFIVLYTIPFIISHNMLFNPSDFISYYTIHCIPCILSHSILLSFIHHILCYLISSTPLHSIVFILSYPTLSHVIWSCVISFYSSYFTLCHCIPFIHFILSMLLYV